MKIIGIAVGALALAGFAQTAAAQAVIEREMVQAPMTAPRGALEINVDTGYTQGFGTLYGSRTMRDLAEAGIGVGLGIGYRALPTISIAATGQFQGFNASNDLPKGTQVRGGAAGIEATFHVAPFERADPWLSLGTGYRMLWEVPPGDMPSTLTHGFEVGKLALGIDLRPSDSVALAPMIGADLNVFPWTSEPGTEMSSVSSPSVSTFVFAGLRGRFDLGGARDARVQQATVIYPARSAR